MKPQRTARGQWIALILLCGVVSGYACRFNVRDVGFVELGKSHYQLYCFHDGAAKADTVANLQSIATASLLDVNVMVELVSLGELEGHAARPYAARPGDVAAPYGALVAPGGRSLRLPLDQIPSEDSAEASLWTRFENVFLSPKRQQLQELIMDAYGVVVVVEGRDEEENRRATKVALEAVKAVTDSMESLPKEIKNPPSLLVLTQEDAKREEVLLWSLGLEQRPPIEPHAAVVYGRGRLMGQAIKGAQIDFNRVKTLLATVGLSCECGLDRSWMQGPMVPLRWDDEALVTLAGRLGFDPESPVIKIEMSQILAKGANARKSTDSDKLVSAGDPGLDALLLGYSEEALDIHEDPMPGLENPGPDPSPIQTPPGMKAVIGSEEGRPSGWDRSSHSRNWLLLGAAGVLTLLSGFLLLLFRGRS